MLLPFIATPPLPRPRSLVIVVVGPLGVIPKNLKGHLKEIGIPNRVRTLQKSALLGKDIILRKVLEVTGLGTGPD